MSVLASGIRRRRHGGYPPAQRGGAHDGFSIQGRRHGGGDGCPGEWRLLAATAGPAGAAVPTCNEATRKYSVSNQYMFIPVYYSTLSPQCNMRRGNKNNAVKYLQRVMRDQYDYTIAVDGDFGPATENALKALQRRLSISADGVYGPQTGTRSVGHSGSTRTPAVGTTANGRGPARSARRCATGRPSVSPAGHGPGSGTTTATAATATATATANAQSGVRTGRRAGQSAEVPACCSVTLNGG